MKDEEIIDLYFARDESAIKETENKYGNYCYVIANNILSDSESSKECLNDTWLVTWNKIPPSRPYIFSSFLAKIVRNISLSRFRDNNALKRGGSEMTLALDELDYLFSDNSNEEKVNEGLLKDSINRFLSLSNESDRKIFVLRYFSFYSIEEIASYYGFSKSRVKMSLFRTREKLKKYLKEEGYTL